MKTLRLLLLIPTILLLGGLGFYSYHHAQAYEESRAALAAQSDAAGRAQQKLDSLTSTITFGLIEDESQTARDTLRAQQEQHHTRSLTSLYAFVALLMLLILVGLFCSPTVYALILATGSLVSLILGLISPILMITIHKQINYLGDVVLSFESKSILGSIAKLVDKGELAVGFTILLFSVLIPLLKILTLIIALIAKELHLANRLIGVFKYLGKWSMIDVFVVATLLVYLSSNSGDLTHAEVSVGLYFFLIYVLLSMITTIQTQKVLEAKSPS